MKISLIRSFFRFISECIIVIKVSVIRLQDIGSTQYLLLLLTVTAASPQKLQFVLHQNYRVTCIAVSETVAKTDRSWIALSVFGRK